MSKNHEQFPQQKFTCVEFERRKICKYDPVRLKHNG